jgi:hypothetical protein
MLPYVSRKVTVPPVSEVAPAFTVAVIVNTDPFAALEGFTVRVVVVAVCALATAKDMTINNAAHKELSRPLRREVLPRAFA